MWQQPLHHRSRRQQPPSGYQQPVSSTARPRHQLSSTTRHRHQQQPQSQYHRPQQPQRQYAPPPQTKPTPPPPPQIRTPPSPPKSKEPYRPFHPPPFTELKPKYDVEHCYHSLEADMEKDPTRARVNGHIVRWINDRKRWKEPPPPKYMLTDFWDDFGETKWTEDTFNIADKQALRDLRTCLREHGVFVRTTRGVSIATTLMEVLKEEEPHVWTPEEIEEQMKFRAKKEKEHQQRDAYIQAKANRQS